MSDQPADPLQQPESTEPPATDVLAGAAAAPEPVVVPAGPVAGAPVLAAPPTDGPAAWVDDPNAVFPASLPAEPRVGDVYPAAVLPGTPPPRPTAVLPGPAYPPSGPIPVAPPNPPYVPRKPRNKTVVWLTVAAVFFVLATATLGTLFLVEVGDHKATSGDLQTTRESLDKTRAELKTAQADKDTAVAAKQRLERDAENTKPCLTAVKGLVRARTEAEFNKFADDVDREC